MRSSRSIRPYAALLALLSVLAPLAAPAVADLASASDRVRVVIELADPPLATYADSMPAVRGVLAARTPDDHLDVAAPAAGKYLGYLARRQRAFERTLVSVSRGAQVHWRYRIAFNGMAVLLRRDTLPAVRALPGVVAVTQTYRLEPELDQSRPQLDLPTMWKGFGSSPVAPGTGRRVALIDSGVNPLHPFFSPQGYTAPEGYPKSERVAGGVRTSLPTSLFASNKVVVGNVYTPPDGTGTPWGPGSIHGTHVAGIMAGVEGTYPFAFGRQTWDLKMSGMLPGAYIMSYVPAGDSAEFMAAVEDVVADKADAVNISLGHSYWLTGDIAHDPLRKALEAAVQAGTVVVASAGNAGTNGDTTVTGSWKLSDKVITVASSSNGRLFANKLSVGGSGSPPASLSNVIAVPAAVPAPPFATTISGSYVVAPGGTGPDAGRACEALPPGEVAGKFVLVKRGGCTFEVKKNNVVNGGGIGIIAYNDAPDLPSVMRFTPPTIFGAMVSLADGRAMVAWAKSDSAPTITVEPETKRLTDASADVVSSFSSRGPAPIMRIKPDIAAPGFNILSSVVETNSGALAPPFFDLLSGTSMSTPHVTGLAAATKALHPTWKPMQIKSALMNTAETKMYLDTTRKTPASVRDRGAGRVRPARLVNPTLTFDPPSVSFGLVRSGSPAAVTVTATDMRRAGPASTASVRVRPLVGHPKVVVTPSSSLSTAPGTSSSVTLNVSTAGAPAGDYEGFVEVRSPSGMYTLPYWVRVQDPSKTKDVLLVDWDRNVGEDMAAVYKDALKSLRLTYDVFDGGTSTAAVGNAGPTLRQLQGYRTVILFTGNNATSWSTAHLGGSFPLQSYLLGGGRLILVGQDLQSQVLYNQNQGSDFLLTTMGGWITGARTVNTPAACQTVKSDADFYAEVTPADSLTTTLQLLGGTVDVSRPSGSSGNRDQLSPDAGRTVSEGDDTDPCIGLYNADNIAPHARVLGTYVTTQRNGVAIPRDTEAAATGVAPDATLERPKPLVPWSAAVLHVGLEGVTASTGTLSRAAALDRLYDFVNDTVTVGITHTATGNTVSLVARAASTSKAKITKYRWSLGDGSAVVETTTPRLRHTFGAARAYTVRVEATDAFTRSGVGVATVDLRTRVGGVRQTRPGSIDLPATEVAGALPDGATPPERVAVGVTPQRAEHSRRAATGAYALGIGSDAPMQGRSMPWVVVAAAAFAASATLLASRRRLRGQR